MASFGTLGDMYPFLAIGQAMRQRGHRVTFLAPAVHEELVLAAGLSFRALGTREAYLALLNDPDVWDSRKGFASLWQAALGNLKEIPAFMASEAPDARCLLLVHPFLLPAAALARARCSDLPIVGAYLAPANMRTVHDPLTIGPLRVPRWLPARWRHWIWRRIDAKLIDPVALPALNAERARQRLEPVAHFATHMHTVADLSLTLFPSWYAMDQPDWPRPLRSSGFPLYEPDPGQSLSAEVLQFLADGDAPIVFTAGTGQRHGERFFAQAIGAVERLGRRAIFLTPVRAQLPGALPVGMLWQAYAPLRALLVRAAAIVHHGGVGTTAEALRAALPQVIVPLAHDQFDNAARVEALGVGRSIKASRAGGRALRSVLHAVLSTPTVKVRCHAVATQLAGAVDMAPTCEAIEGVLGPPRTAR